MTRPEMPLLAIDSSTTAGSVAIGLGSRVLVEVTLGVAGQHSSALMPAVDAAVRWSGLSPRDLGGVVVSGGPGSFTGLRIGAATAKGIVTMLGVPLWSYSGLLAAAAGVALPGAGGEARVCAIFDARRREVFAACYGFARDPGGVRVRTEFGPEALGLDELLARFGSDVPPVFTGDAALLYADELRGRHGIAVAPPHLAAPRGSALLWLAAVAPELGRVDDPSAWEPEYVRASGAERIAAARGAAP